MTTCNTRARTEYWRNEASTRGALLLQAERIMERLTTATGDARENAKELAKKWQAEVDNHYRPNGENK